MRLTNCLFRLSNFIKNERIPGNILIGLVSLQNLYL